jgi:hypothetical protein
MEFDDADLKSDEHAAVAREVSRIDSEHLKELDRQKRQDEFRNMDLDLHLNDDMKALGGMPQIG